MGAVNHRIANQRILEDLDPNVAKIKVMDEHGRERWRDVPDGVRDQDKIVLKSDGTPNVMGKKPGRKARVDLEPVSDVAARIMEEKAKAIEADPLVRTVYHNPESPDVLGAVMKGISEEAASLKFERNEAERLGKETSQISMRRVNALKAAGDAFLKRMDQIHGRGVDLDSPAFLTVMEFIGGTLRTTLLTQCGMRAEEADTVLTKFASTLNSGEWRAELEAKLRR